LAALHAILDDRDRPYYEHRLAAWRLARRKSVVAGDGARIGGRGIGGSGVVIVAY
jgi:hypothetical protein